MPRLNTRSVNNAISETDPSIQVGVGLRHSHYKDALRGASSIDFVEIHAENFFAEGGSARSLLRDVSDIYKISLHATSIGLGSAAEINPIYLKRLKHLVDFINPWLISDHASFSWSDADWTSGSKQSIHAGDLLPIEFNRQSLKVFADNVDRVQQLLGRSILIENISSYIALDHSSMRETDFLLAVVDRTGCRLLIDLNNLLVNAHNFGDGNPLAEAKRWLMHIPKKSVGEMHLAGCTPAAPHSFLIDDHAQAVSDECWNLFRFAIERFGPTPTLIEWDNNLPSWNELLNQATIAKQIIRTTQAKFKVHQYAV